MANKTPVSSLSGLFKKAVALSDDAEAVKKEHRSNIKTLIDKYFQDVPLGKAEGIRTAKELVEIIKLDLLLLGEATERKDDVNVLDEARISRVTAILQNDNPEIMKMMQDMFSAFNEVNDNADAYQSNDVPTTTTNPLATTEESIDITEEGVE